VDAAAIAVAVVAPVPALVLWTLSLGFLAATRDAPWASLAGATARARA